MYGSTNCNIVKMTEGIKGCLISVLNVNVSSSVSDGSWFCRSLDNLRSGCFRVMTSCCTRTSTAPWSKSCGFTPTYAIFSLHPTGRRFYSASLRETLISPRAFLLCPTHKGTTLFLLQHNTHTQHTHTHTHCTSSAYPRIQLLIQQDGHAILDADIFDHSIQYQLLLSIASNYRGTT